MSDLLRNDCSELWLLLQCSLQLFLSSKTSDCLSKFIFLISLLNFIELGVAGYDSILRTGEIISRCCGFSLSYGIAVDLHLFILGVLLSDIQVFFFATQLKSSIDVFRFFCFGGGVISISITSVCLLRLFCLLHCLLGRNGSSSSSMVSMTLGRLGVSVVLLEFFRSSRILDTSILLWPIIMVKNNDIDYKEVGLFILHLGQVIYRCS